MPALAQVSFATAVNQALQNSPRVRTAQDDVKKAQAGLSVMRDIFVPSVVVGGGVGTATGITLSVPTIFTVTSQSLVYSPQQQSLIGSARLDVKAAGLALADARQQAAEDAANTYLTLNHDQSAVAAISEQYEYQLKLVNIVEDRVNAHLDRELDLKKTRRDTLQLHLQLMQAQDDLTAQRAHLSELTGLPESEMVAQSDSIPDLPATPEEGEIHTPESPGMQAAEVNQEARAMRANADTKYTFRPSIGFGGQYGRVSPIENVSEFYNLHGDYNSASIGVQIQFPVLDRVRAAAARESAADASHGAVDLETQKLEQTVEQRKLQRNAAELNVKAQLAGLNYGIAQDELQSLLVSLHSSPGGGPAATPREEQIAHIQERQKYLEMIDTRLDAARAEIDYLRQTGQLEDWLQSLNPAAPMSR
jgi:outer membrane protein TolC